MKRVIFTLVILLAGCASKSKDPVIKRIMELEAKAEVYVSKMEALQGDFGWISADKCDGLLFNGLAAATGRLGIDVKAAGVQGIYTRTPYASCFPEGRSRSSISRDMLLGLAHYFWTKQDRDGIEEFIQAHEASDWIAGAHDGSLDGKSRVLVSPSLRAIFYEMRWRMGGADSGARLIPQVFTPQKGFRIHLQVMTMHLIGRMRGKIPDGWHDLIQAYRDNNMENALFQALASRYGDGDQMNAVELLLSDKYFPAQRLPEHTEYCTDYLWERDQKVPEVIELVDEEGNKTFKITSNMVPNKDWLPCEAKEKHYQGIDWLVAYAVAMGEL